MKTKRIIALTLIVVLAAAAVLPFLNSCNSNDKPDDNPDPLKEKKNTPANISYSVINTYPHDTSSFTEGLLFYKGELYEGTGNKGESKLLKTDLTTGRHLKTAALDKKYFGEGIAIINDTVYQLTYQENTAFAYLAKDFRKVKEFSFTTDTKEGWGLTTDGASLIATDGGSNLYYFKPADFSLIKKVQVTEAGSPAFNLNELEYIDGFIYANQWQYKYILKIDPTTGNVVAKADLTNLVNNVQAKNPKADVLNGIAYNALTKKIYITGKNWPELYEIQFSQ